MFRRRLLVIAMLGIALGLGYGIGVVQPLVVRPALVPGQDAVTDPGSAAVPGTVEDVGGRVLHIRAVGQPRAALVLYPGGLVRPQAYEWLGRALARDGVETWIPEMPADLAVFGKDRADALLAHIRPGLPVIMAGHSLGGAMAADYASRHSDRLRGLILLAAYPADDVTVRAPWPALSLLAENDLVADANAIRAGQTRLPAESQLVTVAGSVHSFFGRYGPQQSDGIPVVSRATAEGEILRAVRDYVAARIGR